MTFVLFSLWYYVNYLDWFINRDLMSANIFQVSFISRISTNKLFCIDIAIPLFLIFKADSRVEPVSNEKVKGKMSLGLPEAKPDTMEEIFSEKCQRIELEAYSLYHFDELEIEGRKYQYRLSSKGDVMTVVCRLAGQDLLLVSVWTNMEHENRIREIHKHILEKEAANPQLGTSQAGGGQSILRFYGY